MRALVFAATEAEIAPFADYLSAKSIPVHICITGVGIAASAYAVTKALLEERPQLAIQAGIAGSFNPDLHIGEVVTVHSECFGQLGTRTAHTFMDIFALGLAEEDRHPYSGGKLINPFGQHDAISKLRSVQGVTVETTSGNRADIDLLTAHFAPDIESMEGASFFYCCLQQGIPFLTLRSISNMVEERNTANWNIPLAVASLNTELIRITEHII